MELTEAEVVRERKRDERGRKIVAPEEREGILAAYEKSGMTQRAFARREGIAYPTFTAWLARWRRRGAGKRPGAFVEAHLPFSSSVRGKLEVMLPCGLIIRGEDAEGIAQLVKALSA